MDRAVRSIHASLDSYITQFGPYPYGHVTVLEVPGDGVGMHAEASMLTHGEGITLMKPDGEDRGLAMPFCVVAPEMGHQWKRAGRIRRGRARALRVPRHLLQREGRRAQQGRGTSCGGS